MSGDATSGTTSFDDVLKRCNEKIDDIEIHFEGGIDAIRRAHMSELRRRPWKWRSAEGTNDPSWTRGGLFRVTIRELQKVASASSPPSGPNEELKNWYDKAGSLREMTNIASRHGANVVIGFEGGRGALRRATESYLATREYKWDWVDHPLGTKDMTNWIPGNEFLSILHEARLLAD